MLIYTVADKWDAAITHFRWDPPHPSSHPYGTVHFNPPPFLVTRAILFHLIMDASPPGPTAPQSSEPTPSIPSVGPPLPGAALAVTPSAAADTTGIKQASTTGVRPPKRNARMTPSNRVTTARPASRGGIPAGQISTGDEPIDVDAIPSEPEGRRRPRAAIRAAKRRMQEQVVEEDDADDADASVEIDEDQLSSEYEPKVQTKARPPPPKKQKRNKGDTCLACAHAGQATECVCDRRVKGCRPCIKAKRPCSFLKEEVATPDDHALPAFVRTLNNNFTLVVDHLERIQDLCDSLHTSLAQVEDVLNSLVPPSHVDPQTSSLPANVLTSPPRRSDVPTVAAGEEIVYGPPGFRPDAARQGEPSAPA
ncbi:hypothetical protein L227DRAFT_611797 [Lentinus tigrinus ALCF2SS1-6]|uniref:Zn(2)-C6 fungal-type domain-containing protein n=1 Tax=Lentinus tigrinus ALCF2SS1-6 TaxID=1328759 RepID=A0A5C2S730_9APHY|nr:hypothetical protein L227DRAFT_611797 [Lentinus tigrinus ALCF2SS1-6]